MHGFNVWALRSMGERDQQGFLCSSPVLMPIVLKDTQLVLIDIMVMLMMILCAKREIFRVFLVQNLSGKIPHGRRRLISYARVSAFGNVGAPSMRQKKFSH